jgi:hypothetical protein
LALAFAEELHQSTQLEMISIWDAGKASIFDNYAYLSHDFQTGKSLENKSYDVN